MTPAMTPAMTHGALPPGTGIGFKPMHTAALLEHGTDLDFVEVHAENCMGAGGPAHAQLDAVRAVFPLSVHGVGLSIGGVDSIDLAHLRRLKRVVERFEAASVSEHLAWSSYGPRFFNDLLPIAYDEATLVRVVAHVRQVQDLLGRQLLVENPSTYVEPAGSTMEEADFLTDLVARSGCGLLLDLNNVVVSCGNRGSAPQDYLARLPLTAVGEIHLAGHACERLDDGSLLRIDDHGSTVNATTWALYATVIERLGPCPTLVEWDTDVPAFEVLAGEARTAARLQRLLAGKAA